MRGAILSDTHCGHHLGLTPPSWHWRYDENAQSRINDLARKQREFWEAFVGLKGDSKYHYAIWAGDMVDGAAKRGGATESVCTDMQDQTDMAVEVVEFVGAKYNYFVRGTAAHVTDSDHEAEDMLVDKLKANGVNATIEDQEFLEAGGIKFDIRHHIGTSSTPEAIPPSLPKEHLHNMVAACEGMEPLCDVTIRGHTHKFRIGGTARWKGFTLPALQGSGCKYARKYSGIVDFGFLEVDTSEGQFSWMERIIPVKCQAKHITVVPSK